MEKYLAKNWLCCGLIGLFSLLLWGQTARFEFVWDDEIYIARNSSIRSLANIPAMFVEKKEQSAEESPTSYRPLRNALYAVLHALGGKENPQPWIFHLANVLWHAATAMLFFLVAVLLCQRLPGAVPDFARLMSLLIALGFAAHPVNSEAVCWAKSMDDLMAGAFVLAAARSILVWNEGGRGYVAALVWFLLASFAKESAVPFALVVFLILVGFHGLPWRRSAELTAPFLFAAFCYAVCRHLVMGETSQCPPLSGTYGQSLIDMFPVAPEYLRLLLGLQPFCIDYNFMVGAPPHPFLSAGVLGGLFVILFFCALAVWLWRRPQWRLSAFGLLWAGLFLLPVSNLIPMMQYMGERFLYIPLMGFLLALGGVFLNCSRLGSRIPAAAAGALVVIWTGTSLNRMGIWRDPLELFLRTELEHPGIKRVEQNAVATIFQLPPIVAGRATNSLSSAQAAGMIATLQNARRIYPENDVLTTQIGLTEAKIGHWRDAVG